MATVAERNIATEARAVEAGHHALVQSDGSVQVVSDTHHDKRYRVEFRAIGSGGPIVFECKPWRGRKLYEDDHKAVASDYAGLLPCVHAAVAARRLEREGLARVDEFGRWVTTIEHVHEFTDGRCDCGEPEDPFDGLS